MGGGRTLSPQSRLQWRRFRSSRRGFVSFLVLGVLVLLTQCSTLWLWEQSDRGPLRGALVIPAFHAVPTTLGCFWVEQ
ncbi:MAG: hypothetical protein R3F31_15350 [Verrucomicrobiales bacterium]